MNKKELTLEETDKMVKEIADITESEIFEKVRNYLILKGIDLDEEHLWEIVNDIGYYIYFQEVREQNKWGLRSPNIFLKTTPPDPEIRSEEYTPPYATPKVR